MMAPVCILFALTVACSAELPRSAEPLTFAVLADTHIDAISQARSRRFESAIRKLNELRPAFVVICGDLVEYPGVRLGREEFLRIAKLLDAEIPLHLVAGNHDFTPGIS